MKRPQLKKLLVLPLIAAALFALALFILYAYAPTQVASEQDTSAMSALWRHLGEARTWRSLLLGGLFLSLALVLVRALGEFSFFVFRKRKGYEAPRLMRDLFSLVAYIILIAIILNSVFSLSLSTLLPTSALLGVILGLALQDTLGNMFAGISLHADKPFQVGDVITVGKFTGVVESITWRAVKIKTFQNHFILVSNSQIAKESIEVCPRDNANARIVFFSALYTDSPIKVTQAVRDAVRECDNVLRYMTPVVRVRDLGTDGVDYEVKYWLKDYARFNDTDALVRQRIWYVFQRERFNFPFPTRTIHLQRSTTQNGAGRDTETLASRLNSVDIFSPLTQDELLALAENAAGRIYAPGEIIIRAGDHGSSMFVVHRGSVDVRVDGDGQHMPQQQRTVNTLREGDFFGEMALFTGEPRTAHVIATAETEVLEIGHEAMRRLFETNPALVESLSHTINERRAVLAAKSATPMSEEDTPAGIFNKIRRFFRLD